MERIRKGSDLPKKKWRSPSIQQKYSQIKLLQRSSGSSGHEGSLFAFFDRNSDGFWPIALQFGIQIVQWVPLKPFPSNNRLGRLHGLYASLSRTNSSSSMISSMRPNKSISSTSFNDAMAISSKEMPKNHTDKERFAAASSCIQTGILTLLFPRKRRRSSPSPFISHRVLEAVASRILKSLIWKSHGRLDATLRMREVVHAPAKRPAFIRTYSLWQGDIFSLRSFYGLQEK